MGFPELAGFPNTLRGYDIVLSVSAEAINNQFQFLYNKEIPEDRLPPPKTISGHEVPLPPARYFINHDFKIFPSPGAEEGDDEDEVEEYSEATATGIDAHIECPVVTFHPTKPGTVILSLTFCRDETAAEGSQDSVLQYWRTRNGKQPIFTKKVINKWTFSWESDVEQRDIDNIIKDLINPAKGSSSTQLSDEAIKQFDDKFKFDDKTVDSSIFTATSMFCLLESVQMTNTFQLTNELGKKEVSADQWALVSTLVVNHFTKLRESQKNPHLPTADDPFVLGYGIRQKLPSLQDIDPIADAKRTPRYFLPRKVDFTTTASPGDKFTNGTFNFCILTHRPVGIPEVDIPTTESDAGRFPDTFFKSLSSAGGSRKSDKRTGGHDAIMGFSKEIFNDYWLNDTICKPLVAKPEKYGNSLRPRGSTQEIRIAKSTPTVNVSAAYHRLDYEHCEIECPEETTHVQKRVAKGANMLRASYTSDFMRYTEEERLQTDLKRNIYIDVEIYHEMKMDFLTKGWNALVMPTKIQLDFWNAVREWKLGRVAWLKSRFTVAYDLTPGAGGIWSLLRDKKRTTVPEEGKEPDIPHFMTEDNNQPPLTWWEFKQGYLLWLSNHNMFRMVADGGEFKQAAKEWNTLQEDHVQATMDSLVNELRGAVIMPAGNVLAFTGLDSDDHGNVFTHADYMTSNEIEKIEGKTEE